MGVVLGLGGRRAEVAAAPVPDADRDVLLRAPTDLAADARSVWTRDAPRAIEERTLTLATAQGFRQYCQQSAYVTALDATINRLGAGTKEAESYLKQYVRLSQRLDASLARFKLTAFGKPATADKPKAAVNPWAQVVGK